MIHHIRKSILDKLATAQSMRYAELKPPNLDGNVFTYHLKGLISEKFVLKNDFGEYSLTQAGKDYIVHRYEESALSAHSIFLIVLQNESNYLLRRRKVQPLIEYAGFMHGEPKAGENVLVSAKKRLCAKTGIENVKLSIAGSALISQYINSELQSFSSAIIIYGKTNKNIKIESDSTGINFWSSLGSTEKLLPSCNDIIKMINEKQTWLEQSYSLD